MLCCLARWTSHFFSQYTPKPWKESMAGLPPLDPPAMSEVAADQFYLSLVRFIWPDYTLLIVKVCQDYFDFDLPSMTIEKQNHLGHELRKKLLLPDARFYGWNAPNSISAGALPQTPLGELTALPRPHSWIEGVLLLRAGEGKCHVSVGVLIRPKH